MLHHSSLDQQQFWLQRLPKDVQSSKGASLMDQYWSSRDVHDNLFDQVKSAADAKDT